LTKLRKSLLPFSLDVEALALAKIIALKGSSNDVDLVFFLSNAEVNAVIHHFTKSLELSLGYIKLDNLRARYIRAPVKALRLIPSNDEDVLFINHYYFSLADLPIVDFEA